MLYPPPPLLLPAFTLAEVLITLVVIGVIAAMTIPTLINKTNEQERKSQFKKSYLTLSQALYKTQMNDFYGYAQCYYPYPAVNPSNPYEATECNRFFNAFAKNLQVQKVCNGNSKADGCIPDYKYANFNGGCSGFNSSARENIDRTFVLSDGQIIIVYSLNSYTNSFPLFLIDINGHKGPNAYGDDLFTFQILKGNDTGTYIGTDGRCQSSTDGRRTTEEMMSSALAGKN